MHVYDIEVTDTFGGEANYCWVKRFTITMPELTHYGYDGGSNYAKANRIFERELMKKAKALAGFTGLQGVKCSYGDDISFKPYGLNLIMFINYREWVGS